MKNKQQILKQKYRDELADSYIRGLIRGKGVMNYQITQKMIDDKRASVRLEREKEEMLKWRHFEDGQYPENFQQCIFIDKNNDRYIGSYQEHKNNYFYVMYHPSIFIEAIAWQPAPTYKP